MATRYFALIFGIIYLLVGLMGLIPGLLQPMEAGNPRGSEVTPNV